MVGDVQQERLGGRRHQDMRGGSIGPLLLKVGWVGRIPRDPGGVPLGDPCH